MSRRARRKCRARHTQIAYCTLNCFHCSCNPFQCCFLGSVHQIVQSLRIHLPFTFIHTYIDALGTLTGTMCMLRCLARTLLGLTSALFSLTLSLAHLFFHLPSYILCPIGT